MSQNCRRQQGSCVQLSYAVLLLQMHMSCLPVGRISHSRALLVPQQRHAGYLKGRCIEDGNLVCVRAHAQSRRSESEAAQTGCNSSSSGSSSSSLLHQPYGRPSLAAVYTSASTSTKQQVTVSHLRGPYSCLERHAFLMCCVCYGTLSLVRCLPAGQLICTYRDFWHAMPCNLVHYHAGQ